MPAARDLTVAVVDDMRSMRAIVRDCLNQIGVTNVTEFGDGAAALEAMKAFPSHLIISDMNMPVMDGLDLLAAVRKTPGLERIAFIMLTSRGDVDLVKKAIALGVNNYLTKPFTAATLRKKIEAVVGALT